MDDQGVRVDHVDRAFRVRDAVGPLALLRHQLRRAEVREDERDAVILHDRVRRGELRLLQRGALRSDAHRDPDLGRGLREVRIDLFPHAESPGHRGDDEGRPELLAEELHAQIDRVQVDLREGIVHEADVVPIVVFRGDVLLQDDVDVLRLPLFRLRRLDHLRDLGRSGCRRPAGLGVHPGLGSLRYR